MSEEGVDMGETVWGLRGEPRGKHAGPLLFCGGRC